MNGTPETINPAGMTFDRAMEIAIESREKATGHKYEPMGAEHSPAQRRVEIMRLTERGETARQIADRFHLTTRTIERVRVAARKAAGG